MEEFSPVAAAAIAVIVLSRSGFQNKINEYRRDTLDLIRLRSETLEKELADAHMQVQELARDLRTRDRRIEALEDEVDAYRQGPVPHPPARPRRRPVPAPETPLPSPHHAPDVDDPT